MNVDCENATITLANGEEIKGDVVIGADGVHVSKDLFYISKSLESDGE